MRGVQRMTGNNRNVADCVGKIRFDSWSLATQVRQERGKRSDQRSRRQVYRCAHCGGFHLGYSSRKPRPAKG